MLLSTISSWPYPKQLAIDKHSSLLRTFINYGRKKVLYHYAQVTSCQLKMLKLKMLANPPRQASLWYVRRRRRTWLAPASSSSPEIRLRRWPRSAWAGRRWKRESWRPWRSSTAPLGCRCARRRRNPSVWGVSCKNSKSVFIWQNFLAKLMKQWQCCATEIYVVCTCFGSFGWCDTNRIISICVTSSQVSKASTDVDKLVKNCKTMNTNYNYMGDKEDRENFLTVIVRNLIQQV